MTLEEWRETAGFWEQVRVALAVDMAAPRPLAGLMAALIGATGGMALVGAVILLATVLFDA